MSTKVISTQKGDIEVNITGRGVPILIAHGGHSSCKERILHKGMDLNRFLLITPSRPGYGNTPLADRVSPQDTAELFNALLDELQLEAVILVGLSAGGLSALAFASYFPARVKKLVLVSAVTKKWMSEKDGTYLRAKKLFAPGREKYTWGLFRFFSRLFPRMMAGVLFKELSGFQPINMTNGEIAELFAMINLQRSKEGFVNDLDQDLGEEVVQRISCPTFILHGSYDKSVPVAHAQFAHATIKHSILKIYDNKWGHLLWLGNEGSLPIHDMLGFIEGP
ncbi:alpha/beta fold hydrolase [Pleomorphovibrio marinus]|uniref:alpha/beta fold hydrolase n=1 Tax=Pleomorphovibrio marinus TaxID=2164132 RepID=UPI000E0C6D6B|nr:alpha/beta hydrolase [Pleomorphovibrio marinus]